MSLDSPSYHKLSEVQRPRVLREIGLAKFLDLEELFSRLYGEVKDPQLSFRLAPSIVMKGEAGVFGISVPRFALRAVYKKSQDDAMRAFINLRRICTFCRQRSDWLEGTSRHGKPRDVIRLASPVADSVFTVPPWLKGGDCHVMETALGVAYGEEDRSDTAPKMKGLPFMNHIRLAGGGLCAQAACFICAAILNEHATALHNLAEITLKASDLKDPSVLEITGRSVREMITYFRKIELNATYQQAFLQPGTGPVHRKSHVPKKPPGRTSPQDPPPRDGEFERLFALCLNAYVRSNMPVVLPLNMLFMRFPDQRNATTEVKNKDRWYFAPDGIYGRNEQRIPSGLIAQLRMKPKTVEEKESSDHVVVAVGIRGPLDNPEIICSDPATIPFLCAPVSEINKCARKMPDKQQPNSCVPVTPGPVKLTLMDDSRFLRGRVMVAHGLFTQVTRSRSKADRALPSRILPEDLRPFDVADQFGHLRLLQLHQVLDPTSLDFASLKAEHKERWKYCTDHIRQHLPSLGMKETTWVWAEDLLDSLWIWNAECEMPPVDRESGRDARSGFLRFILDFKQDPLVRSFFPDEPIEATPVDPMVEESAPVPNDAPAMNTPLQASCITSFEVNGMEQSLALLLKEESFKNPTLALEVYAFMQSDVHRLLHSRMESKRHGLGGSTSQRIYEWGYQAAKKMTPRLPVKTTWNVWCKQKWLNRSCLWVHSKLTTLRGEPAVGCMARFADREAKILKVARRMFRMTQIQQGGRKVPVVALATYLPEIAFITDSEKDSKEESKGGEAQKALIFAVKLAGALRKLQGRSHMVVELVAGSRIKGLRVKKSITDTESYEAALAPPQDAIGNFIKQLEPVAKIAEDRGVFLAVELEPSDLAVLGDYGGVWEMARQLDELPADSCARRRVGFNLDIAHWAFIAQGIKPGMFGAQMSDVDRRVFRRIVHAHVSDHSKGHLGDLSIGQIHGIEDFKPWIDVLHHRALLKDEPQKLAGETGKDTPVFPFSGHISVELEACKSSKFVAESLRILQELL